MAVETQEMIDEVRLLSNLRRSTYFTDAEILKFLNDGIDELRDMIVAAYEHYFVKTFDFTLTGDTAQVDLPADFYKANVLVIDPGLATERRIPQVSNYLERAQGAPLLSASYGDGIGRQYLIEELQLKMLANGQPSASQGSYRLYYTYLMPKLALPIVVDLAVTPDFTVDLCTAAPLTGSWSVFGPTMSLVGLTSDPPLTIDGQPLMLGNLILIQKDDAPISPLQMGVWSYDGLDQSGSILEYRFTRAPTFADFTSISAGYKIGVRKGDVYGGIVLVAQDNWIVQSDTTLFRGANYAATASPRFVFANPTFTWDALQSVGRIGWYSDGFIRLLNTPSNGGVDWPITNVANEFQTLVSQPGFSLLTPFNIPPTAIVQIMFTSLSYQLPAQLLPWKLYPIVFAALTIRKARQQGATDLESQIEGLKARIAKMSANRTEEVTRAPYLRRNRGGWGGAFGGGY